MGAPELAGIEEPVDAAAGALVALVVLMASPMISKDVTGVRIVLRSPFFHIPV